MSDFFAIPWPVACQAPLSLGFPRCEYWRGCHFLLLGIFPAQGSNLHILCLLLWQAVLYHCATREIQLAPAFHLSSIIIFLLGECFCWLLKFFTERPIKEGKKKLSLSVVKCHVNVCVYLAYFRANIVQIWIAYLILYILVIDWLKWWRILKSLAKLSWINVLHV